MWKTLGCIDLKSFPATWFFQFSIGISYQRRHRILRNAQYLYEKAINALPGSAGFFTAHLSRRD
jgi:hypothetical protein